MLPRNTSETVTSKTEKKEKNLYIYIYRQTDR